MSAFGSLRLGLGWSRGGGSRLWRPTDSDQLLHWWDMQTGMTESEGVVTGVADRAPGGQAILANEGYRGTAGTQINGLPSLSLGGAHAYFPSGLSVAQTFTMVAIAQWDAVTGNNHLLANAARFYARSVDNAIVMNAGSFAASNFIVSTGTVYIIVQEFSNSADKLFVDGAGYTHTTPGTGGLSTPTIGARTQTGVDGMDGAIGEMLLLSGALDEATRQTFEGYLAHRWAATGNLAVDHPYKTEAPMMNALDGDILAVSATGGFSPDGVNHLKIAA